MYTGFQQRRHILLKVRSARASAPAFGTAAARGNVPARDTELTLDVASTRRGVNSVSP